MKRRIFLVLLLSLFVFISYSSAQEKPVNLATSCVDGRIGSDWHAKLWQKRFAEKQAQAEKGKIDVVFLGDSITHFWETNGKDVYDNVFGKYQILNTAVAGDRTQHVLWVLKKSKIIDPLDPKLFVVMIGTNNVGWKETDPAQTVDGIKEILKTIRFMKPDAKIVLFDVFPRGANNKDSLREKVNEINKGIPALCDGKNIFHCSINKELLESDGETLTRDMMPDLLHPGPKGYKIWAKTLLPYFEQYVGKR